MDDSEESDGENGGAEICRKGLHPLMALISGACLLVLAGWMGEVVPWLHWCTILAGLVFAVERGTELMKIRRRDGISRGQALHGVLALLVGVVSLDLLFRGEMGTGVWLVGEHLFVLASVLLSGLVWMVAHQTRFTKRAFHPGLVLIVSFLFIVIAGALLLKMPRCVVPGQTCSWLDAFFTSTSAVCVTGLTTQNPATYFSTTGQVIILGLIQIGGLGIMTLTFFAAVVLFEGLSLHDRLLLGKMIQENRLARVGRTLTFIIALTFICEGVGAAILFFSMEGIPTIGERLYHSVFHSVSAFCNAGFSTLPANLASTEVKANGIWQTVIMALIVIGGLGALVNEDVCQWAMAKWRRKFRKEGPLPRLRVHTRLVLVASGILIAGGAAAVGITEFWMTSGPENGGRFLTSMFHSVTARTAGFNTVPMTTIAPLTAQVIMILMIIGGSPGGTAGGLRTTVVAIALGHLWSQLRMGRRGMIVFNRTIPAETGSRALGLVFLTFIWLMVNFMILQALQAGSGFSESALLFELISAFATVGLSLDLTASLADSSKVLLIVNMFVGRIGLLTVMATLIPPDTCPASGKPKEDILLT
ncbi:MAG: potassium transporter TrkG [Verrucomicrobiota bacterium]